MIKKIPLFLIAALIVSHAGLSSAAVIYDNGTPSTDNGIQIGGSDETADDFTLAAGGSVASVGFYFQNYNGITGWDNQVSYNIYANALGTPGALLASGAGQNVSASESAYAWCCGGGNAWEVVFDLTSIFVASPATTYWLGITGAGGSTPWWVTSGTGNGVRDLGSGFGSTGYDFAFYLDDTTVSAVPVPAAAWLFGSALLGLGMVKRRKA